jgi:hypothetical protein
MPRGGAVIRQGSWPLSVHLTALGMEFCSIYSGLTLMREHLGWELAPFLIILLCYPSVFLVNLGLTEWIRTTTRDRFLFSLGLAFAFGTAAFSLLDIGFPQDIGFSQKDLIGLMFQIAFCVFLWRLGVNVIPRRTDHNDIHVRFQIAALVILASVVLGAKTLIPVILFPIFAIPALCLARWSSSSFLGMGILQPMRLRFSVLGIASILIPGTILLLFLSPDFAQALLRAFTGLGSFIARWLDQIVTPTITGKPAEISFLSGCTMNASKDASGFRDTHLLAGGEGMGSGQVFLWFIIAGFLLAVVLVFLKVTIFRVKRGKEEVKAVAFETDSFKSSLSKHMIHLLKSIGRMLRRLFRLIGEGGSAFFRRPKLNDMPLSTPKNLYRELLRWAARQHVPRSLSQTPFEYLKIISGRFPQKEKELFLITEVYIRARYGRIPPSKEAFEGALMAWSRVTSDL